MANRGAPETDESRLFEQVRDIDDVWAHGMSVTSGEKMMPAPASLIARLDRIERSDPPVELRFTFPDPWAHMVFVALIRRCRRTPYRYPGQRRTTVMVKISRRFIDEVLWPELEAIYQRLHAYFTDLTQRVVDEVLAPETTTVTMVDAVPAASSDVPTYTSDSTAETPPAKRAERSESQNPSTTRRAKRASRHRRDKKRRR